MSAPANPHRGEVSLLLAGAERVLRPSFAALVAAEEELGSLFALVERAAKGELRLGDVAGLYWHCLVERAELTREALGDELARLGLAAATRPLRTLLGQILQGAAGDFGDGT